MALFELFQRAIPPHAVVQGRDEGAAFLGVARNLYRFSHVDYLALNVPGRKWRKTYMHCRHSDEALSQCASDAAASHDLVVQLDWPLLKSLDSLPLSDWKAQVSLPADHGGVVFALRTQCSEIAIAVVTWDQTSTVTGEQHDLAVRDIRLLMNYFHGQMLRINGVEAENEILLSARELDCLSWTAAGKTAWEASMILGISERTVRFHLNVAREKLQCTTTTQAVAKAITNKLISLTA